MNEMQKQMIKRIGLSEDEFEPTEIDRDALAEEAYLKAEYNSVLIEMMMEDSE